MTRETGAEPIIGMDLGTTHSLVAVFRDGRPELIPNALGKPLTPSVVGLVGGDRILVGEPAHALRFRHPDRCAWCFKRWMGTDRKLDLAGHELSAPELSALILSSLKSDAEAFLGTPVRSAVISVPAYFDEHQRRATTTAGKIAGLRVRRIVNEPTAAALAYGLADPEGESTLLVVDLGGGTFDVTLMEVFEGSLEIVATAGESRLGGEDFTLALLRHAAESFGLDGEAMERREPLRFAALRHEVERAKRRLAAASVDEASEEIRCPDAGGAILPSAPVCTVSESGFRRVVEPLIRRLRHPILRTLRDAGVSAADVDHVLLVGGATRMPLVRDLLRELAGQDPAARQNPDHAVALGAAVQAALVADDVAVADLVVTDVAPFTLGVEVSKTIGSQLRDGYYLPIIHRNTTVPVAREESVGTVYRNQREVVVKVYQGESRRVKDHLFLGELTVSGIPPGPAGQQIRIRFAYDANGLLEVGATVVSTGKSFETVIVHPQSTLAPDAVEQALARLRRVTALPRDDSENLMLLHYAEKLVPEVAPADRERLEQTLDAYESALELDDREHFVEARRRLRELLEELDVSELEH